MRSILFGPLFAKLVAAGRIAVNVDRISAVDEDVDVVVIGAGYSGLSAARDLRNAGLSVKVFEANARVGGRALSYNLEEIGLKGGTLEFGGQWLNPRDDHPHAWQLMVDELGFEALPAGVIGEGDGASKFFTMSHPEGFALNGSVIANIQNVGLGLPAEVAWMWAEMSHDKLWLPHGQERLDSMTWEDWLQSHSLSPQGYEFMRSFFGMSQLYAEPRDISALEAVKTLGGFTVLDDGDAPTYMIKGGIQGPAIAIADWLGERLHLDTPVNAITQDETGALVEAQQRGGSVIRVRAKRVLFSGPPHASLKIRFEPELPAAKLALFEKLPMGNFVKLQLVYRKPFWKELGYSGTVLNIADVMGGPSNCLDNAPPDGSGEGVMLCFSAGDWGRQLMSQSEDQQKEILTDWLVKAFGSDEAKSPLLYTKHDWGTEPYIEGAVSPLFPPGAMTAYSAHISSDFQHVIWIGADVSQPLFGPQIGFYTGAIKSGRETAARVIEELQATT